MQVVNHPNRSKQMPAGMVEVSKERFFALLYAEKRDIMPKNDARDFTNWVTRDRERWGWTQPGWASEHGTPAIYAVNRSTAEGR